MILRAGKVTWSFPRPVLLMGILNVTPDSFADGGRYLAPEAAVRRGLELVEEGADIIDVGGESTRPQAEPVSEAEELRRILPVLKGLAKATSIPISVDTMKATVARAALEHGACLINDVAANREDETLWRVVAGAGAGYVAMHMQGTPQTMQVAPHYQDVVSEVHAFFQERLQRLQQAGVREEQVLLDVGLGFGKSRTHNLQLLARLDSFKKWNRPLLLGASRKSFLGHIGGADHADDRLPASLACAAWAAQRGVQVLRVHDVAATRQATRIVEALLAVDA
jgi:dihydropteroate synthase